MSSFEDLPDLSLIEILSYLSCVDALWTFSELNSRLTRLLFERGFYRHINLSFTRYYQFRTLLSLLRLNEIESLVIDCYASSLQLSKWPYLPHLKILRVKGLRDYIDIFNFTLQHVNTLTHLTVESNVHYIMTGLKYKVSDVPENLEDFMIKVLHRLLNLRSLDFGMESSFFLHPWCLKTIEIPLTYLRITTSAIPTIVHLMLTQPLPHTLQQFHVKLNNNCKALQINISSVKLLTRMEVLHTFTFSKSFDWHFPEEWTFVDILTSSKVMPILQRMNFSIVIESNDVDHMNHSALFTDYRNVDIHYAFIINDNRLHSEISQYIPHGSQSHPREIGSATFISDCWPDDQLCKTPGQYYCKKEKSRQHLFYTLPWFFNEFFQLCVPDRCINELQVFTSIGSSRLMKLTVSDNIAVSIDVLSHIMSSDQIVELDLFRCDRQVSLHFPFVTHLILIDSLDSLNSRSLSTNIRSIQLILHHECLAFTSGDWTALRMLSNLPLLNSLRVILYNMLNPPDDTSCEVIAETASMVTDFGFWFRWHFWRYDEINRNVDPIKTKHSLFIERLQNRILTLSLNQELHVVVDKDTTAYGIVVWF